MNIRRRRWMTSSSTATSTSVTPPTVEDVRAEWSGDSSHGISAEVVLRVRTHDSSSTPAYVQDKQTEVIIRLEEILLVLLILLLWLSALLLFFNRWGKIRSLEPYQPKFTKPMKSESLLSVESEKILKRMKNPRLSLSKYNITATSPLSSRRRQNSVFISPPPLGRVCPARRVKSAMDLRFKRPSITIDVPNVERRQSSIPVLPTRAVTRRQSSFPVRPRRKPPLTRHRHFITVEEYRGNDPSLTSSCDDMPLENLEFSKVSDV